MRRIATQEIPSVYEHRSNIGEGCTVRIITDYHNGQLLVRTSLLGGQLSKDVLVWEADYYEGTMPKDEAMRQREVHNVLRHV